MFSKSRFNPSAGVTDFWGYIRRPQPYRLPILLVSAIPFSLIFYWAISERVYIPPERPDVTFITTYAAGRSDAEIIESNIANQRRKDELQAQIDAIEAEKKQMYRDLGRATGLDVDAMEAKIAEDEASAEAERTARHSRSGTDTTTPSSTASNGE